ncbi:hypothetical protein AAF712_004662 [Marasmius tenuissimus]|uniref:Uncharacterized protein n=1 Tax=Marasmius tenuissimus TaxID=585030 RepID=A0ABR3A3Z2_9AGAR
MSPTPSRSPTPSVLEFTTPRPDETIPEYITKKPKVLEYLGRYSEDEEEKATAEFKSDVEAWTTKRNEWNAEQQEEIDGRIADWEKERADAERKLAEWRAERDSRAEARRKQRETEEEEIRRETMVPEEVKSEPFEFHFSDADKQSIDMDWDSFYLSLTQPQQMVFQSGFAAGKKSAEKATTGGGGARRKGKAKETGRGITDPEEVGLGPLLPIVFRAGRGM